METYYRETQNELSVFEVCFKNKLPLLLKGPTGCGKSQLVSHMAEKLGRPLIKVACNEDTSSADLLGRFLIKGADTIWQDGPVSRAVREGAILYLDEVAEAREDVIVALHPLTDHRRQLYLDRTNEELTAAPGFMCVASFNPGYQRGFKELKPSTRQRFVTLALNYPQAEIESEIVAQVTGIELKTAKLLVQLAHKIRSQSHLDLRETISTRLLVHTAQLAIAGLPLRQACRFGIAQCLSDDPQIIEGLQDLINLSL
ncbi:MAG TPA: CbbQ/NirQ/NorQ/GpvN family protein [Pseudobdellovibrionaceae bacterium]|jgi:nitric oxide reductase NorQ protein|nr:CbbQ/NirQ/NorQ/GpvN family protein [Pseudobdellovibrionaceae bacterium]